MTHFPPKSYNFDATNPQNPTKIIFNREKTTVFLTVSLKEELESVKQRLSNALNKPINDIQLRSIDNKLYDVEKTIQQLRIKDSDMIYFVYKIDNDTWEDVNVYTIGTTTNNNNNNNTTNNNKQETSSSEDDDSEDDMKIIN